jgi:two-component system, chemotaxis family, chemotaxis protein CheY
MAIYHSICRLLCYRGNIPYNKHYLSLLNTQLIQEKTLTQTLKTDKKSSENTSNNKVWQTSTNPMLNDETQDTRKHDTAIQKPFISYRKSYDIKRQTDMGTIMIVDDASFMRAVLKKIVLQAGHEVVAEAGNGDDAISQFQSVHPDLVLMDIIMPPGPKAKDGIEALKQIVTANPAAKVVMCSSMGQQALIAEALKSGAKDFVIKPFQPQKVLEVLSKYA